MKPLLRSLVPDQLADIPQLENLKPFRAKQLREWVFTHDAFQWDQMSNLPAAVRTDLAESFDLNALELDTRQESYDGTRKFLFKLRDGQTVESVIIPMADHPTFCISSQVGCAMACSFCATARGGLVRQLEAGEIVEQVQRLRRDVADQPFDHFGHRQFNVVFMGMGEPLDNWQNVALALEIMKHAAGLNMSRRRIQVSTSGPASGLENLIRDNPGVGLTLSLGGSNDQDRRRIMPVPGRTGVLAAVDLAARYAKLNARPVTLAWVLIKEQTDLPAMAAELAALALRGAFKVNLIPMNPLDDGKLEPSSEQRILDFQKILTDKGVPAFVRASGGRDIAAACGQLRRRRQQGSE